ncbi:hypothetical protein VHEMI04344 [[Torrubiella] hemipterigena]|uniref:Uncharacterized protein n=1 Tax=[Torrubiella] hemipterigena TaxID=1531966 RepID=A0A0A1T0Z1_9HYPO|nr:hypothetical protein VHEMI04344 [[Torrubiella] hemipterigena]
MPSKARAEAAKVQKIKNDRKKELNRLAQVRYRASQKQKIAALEDALKNIEGDAPGEYVSQDAGFEFDAIMGIGIASPSNVLASNGDSWTGQDFSLDMNGMAGLGLTETQESLVVPDKQAQERRPLSENDVLAASLMQLTDNPPPPPPWSESPATESVATISMPPLGTPLHLALEKHDEPMTVFLVNSGASLTQLGPNGQAALHIAVESSTDSILRYIIRKTKNVNILNNMEQTPLIRAVIAGRNSAVEMLLKERADANFKDCHEKTALHYAVQEGSTTLAALLIKHGASVDG